MHEITMHHSILRAMYRAGSISLEVFTLAYESRFEEYEERYGNYPTNGKREKCTLNRTSNHICPPEFYQAWMEYMKEVQ